MNTSRLNPLWLMILLVGFCSPARLAAAPKPADDDDVPVAEGPAEESAKPREESAPSEDDDELLRAIEAKKAAAEEIDRLERAIEGMRNAQKRIGASDTSAQTQKIQERVVKDLEELLELLRKQQSRQSSSQQSPNQKQDPHQKNQRQKMEKNRGDPQNSESQGDRRNDDKSADSQERTDAARAKAAEDARRAQMLKDVWGHLPPHLREAIRNALRDNYLPKYDDLVKKYYEALAEKNRKRTRQMTSVESVREEGAEPVRLQRYLAMAGAGSRRHCEDFILTGRVTVDGRTITELGFRVVPGEQEVRLDGERVRLERKIWYLLNKPIGYLCTNSDPGGRPRVIDLFPRGRERLFTVGRLDEHSQGLLLVTNDGELSHMLAHPRFRVRKIYQVQVAGIPTKEILDQLKRGLYFAEGRFKVADARLVRTRGSSAILELELLEGQNREIRRLLAKMGHKVQRLERVALGSLELGDLPVGHYRQLALHEIASLSALVTGRKPGRGRRKGAFGKREERKPGQKSPRWTPGQRAAGSKRHKRR